MSLYIPGVKMPERCWDCPLCYDMMSCRITGLNWYRDTVDLSIDPVEERMPNCPLIEVPPHGRLVDEKQILKLIDEQRNWEYNKTHSPNMTWSRIVDAFEWIMQMAATIIPADKENT